MDSESQIEFKTDSFKPSEEYDSNVEVTGEALEAVCGAGMFVV